MSPVGEPHRKGLGNSEIGYQGSPKLELHLHQVASTSNTQELMELNGMHVPLCFVFSSLQLSPWHLQLNLALCLSPR